MPSNGRKLMKMNKKTPLPSGGLQKRPQWLKPTDWLRRRGRNSSVKTKNENESRQCSVNKKILGD